MWYNIKAKVVDFFADIRFYWCGIILFGDSHYKIKGPHMRHILDIIQPGDVLLRRYDHYLGSVVIKGFWSHAAFYAGEDNVIHMLGKGITKEDILTFMRTDHVAVLRPKDPTLIPQAIELANQQLGKGLINNGPRNIQYDYDFDTDKPDKQYCTEFVNYIFGRPIDKKVITPDDVLVSDFFNIISFVMGK